MDEQQYNDPRPANPRRRKRSKLQIFKEAYLPIVIAAAAVVLIVIFVIGSVSRSIQLKKAEKEASIAASQAEVLEKERLTAEANNLIQEAEPLAAQYDYLGAIEILESFTGTIAEFPLLADKHAEYKRAQEQLVAWEDPNDVLNLSFQLLVADAARTFEHPSYAILFNRNFITTQEFSKMLLQLYENGYILVSMDDFIASEVSSTGKTVYASKPLYLPEGKKPLMLTQTNVNYNIYLIDSNGDRFPDKDGGGFATKLVLDENGEITCEMIDSSGQTVTGAFDLVPILNDFIKSHPDFSYKGARATLALTGYNGLFGYRTNADSKDYFGVTVYEKDVEGAKAVAAKLLEDGYEFACYTYENIGYGESGVSVIKADLELWNKEVVPILGNVDLLVYAQNSDIAPKSDLYTGDKYDVLQEYGFTRFMGFAEDGACWFNMNGEYLRQGRLMVTGSNVAHKPEWFEGLFDAANILDASRGNVPA